MKEDASSERRHRELLPLSIHQQRVIVWFVLKRNFGLFFPKNKLFFIPEKRLNFFFSKTNTTIILYARKNLSVKEQQQHATTTAKESTSEKSGEREDGFEGTRERRTFGVCAFEDS